jgi:hypothetical protein
MVGFQQFTEFNDRHRYSTVKLHGLAWLLAEVMDYNRLCCHLYNVRRMRTVELCTEQLRKIIVDEQSVNLRKTTYLI